MEEKADRQFIHQPVLLEAVLDCLRPGVSVLGTEEAAFTDAAVHQPCVMVDATTGEGGHAEAFLSRFPEVFMLCVDADAEQLERARIRLSGFEGRVEFHHCRFGEFFNRYASFSRKKPDRILFDLGISSRHYEESGRGFSFCRDESLDMRLDTGDTLTAGGIVNTWPQKKLEDILFRCGEERYAKNIARGIAAARGKKPITTTKELERIVWKAVPPEYRFRKIHPATKTFQALRIVVNRELEELEKGLAGGFEVLKPRGRMGVISFHSLEDRIVKRFFRDKNRGCTCPPELPICQCKGEKELVRVTRKPLVADSGEIRRNPRSRSAKFRVVEKC